MGTFGGAGEDGLSANITQAFAKSSDGSIPGMALLTQGPVEELLKALVQGSPGWLGAHEAGFAGLPAGIPLVLGLLAKLAEQITGIPVSTWVDQWLDDPTVGALGGIVGEALGKIFTVSASLQSLFDSLDFTDPDFNPALALITWITNDLIPTGLFNLFDFENLIEALTIIAFGDADVGSGDLGLLDEGLELDASLLGETTAIQKLFLVLRGFLDVVGLDFETLDVTDLPSVIQSIATGFIANVLNPLGILANIADFDDLASAIDDALNGIPVAGGYLGSIWDSFTHALGLTTAAQTTGDVALTELALLKAAVQGQITGGEVFTEDFSGTNATTLTGYTQVSIGGGAGTYGRRDGYGHWYAGGGLDQTILSIKDSSLLMSPLQRSAMKLKTAVGTGDRSLWLCGRCSDDGDDVMFVHVLNGGFQLGYYVGGTVDIIDTISGEGSDAGELWELELGEAGSTVGDNDWLWLLKRNGETLFNDVVDLTDIDSGLSLFLDTDHRSPAFAMTADNFFGVQSIPSDLEAVTWADI